MEAQSIFAARRFCDKTCKGRAQAAANAERRRLAVAAPIKWCPGCDRELSTDAFTYLPSRDTYRHRCDECEVAWQRRYRNENLEYLRPKEARKARRQRARRKATVGPAFFRERAKAWGTRGAVTADELEDLWLDQGGRCALTGRELTPEAHLDHRLPLCRGGETTIDNLQWVCEEANRAKARLTDDEFLALCREVVERAGA